MLKSIAVVSLTLFTASVAAADTDAPPASPSSRPSVAITISPVHLVIPMAEVTVEARVADRFGIAAIAGIGSFRDAVTDTRIALYEGGASARYYALGSFGKGLQVGAEAVYVFAATDNTDVEVRAAGLALSPFVGAKWTHSSGFTLEGQGGVSFMALRAKAETGAMSERSGIGPMLNLNLGYSF